MQRRQVLRIGDTANLERTCLNTNPEPPTLNPEPDSTAIIDVSHAPDSGHQRRRRIAPRAFMRWRRRCARLGEVTVVAPHRRGERDRPRADAAAAAAARARSRDGVYAVDGTPTDCVNIAHHAGVRRALPDLVVSGINKGWNLGDDVTYSGTVAARSKAALLGIPSIAVSLRADARRRTTSATRRARRRRSPRRCCGGRCRRGRSSTSTCRTGSRRGSA